MALEATSFLKFLATSCKKADMIVYKKAVYLRLSAP